MPTSTHFGIPTSAYVHIPFCRRRCFYCDFPVSIVGDRPPRSRQADASQQFGTIAEYLHHLIQEIEATPSWGASLQTIFLGGGTPSLLTAQQLDQILDVLDQRFGIESTAEISIEMDPGTFDQRRLSGYQAAGVNRISLGVQAFQADLLAACGRTHTPEDVSEAIAMLKQANIANVSLDLISGLPHQTVDQWHDSLRQAIEYGPAHLSIYDLTIEPMTAFSRWYEPGSDPLPTDEMTADMYRIAEHTLTAAGYEHYEISNYARPGYSCRHNRIYWENRPYYGFGMGAASYINGHRWSRPRNRRDYYTWVPTFVQNDGQLDCPVTPPNETLLDTLMLGLRLSDGIRIDTLICQFGEPSVQRMLRCLSPYAEQGWVVLESHSGRSPRLLIPDAIPDATTLDNLSERRPLLEGHRIRLTDPEGFLFSNRVLAEIFKEFSSE
ncbi:MAG TPA: radical SAM family heme chaperone HemW [Elainellaceae cyanobacterium]|jgi:oxygen-independent coproporphyrinogen-3 oxidase